MKTSMRTPLLFVAVAALFILEGSTNWWIFSGSWTAALGILNMALLSAIMALGVNMQWGYAGLFNTGIMGFAALGGLATVLVGTQPTAGAFPWELGADGLPQGGWRILMGLAFGALTIAAAIFAQRRLPKGRMRGLSTLAIIVVGFFVYRWIFDGGVELVEKINPATSGNIGGLGLPIIVSWPVGGLFAAAAAWVIGKTALGLRSDYLAIATLGIAEIIIAVLKNEDWLARGVKNIIGLPRPVAYEVNLQADPAFVERAANWGLDPATASTIWVKLSYSVLFAAVLIVVMVGAQLALNSPWGRMMRAIRDNETAAEAMGKNVTRRHLHIFIIGSAVCGIAGAMATTMDGVLNPGAYQPLRYTFLIWVMVIVGGSGNNWGAVLGGFLIWWLWNAVEPLGIWLSNILTVGLPDGNWFKTSMQDAAAHFRLFTMGIILLVVLRFSPRGLIPEK